MPIKRVLKLLVLAAASALAPERISTAQAWPQSYLVAQSQRNDTGKDRAVSMTPAQVTADTRSADSPGSAIPDRARLFGIRFVSSKSHTRVMLDLSHEIRFAATRLKEDPSKGLPPRIYIDLFGTKLAMDSKEAIKVEDGLLSQVRVAQFSQDVVRVVLDMTSLRDHNAFLLPDPYRLVVDIQGHAGSATPIAVAKARPVVPAIKEPRPPPAGIRKIVLDPGHGGKDPGAVGVGGITEKDVVLSVAKKLAGKLKREMGMDVVLTRKDDTFIPLEDRTAMANAEEADLFISLHMNASPNGDARGIETYYLDKTTDEAALRLAARENGTSRKNVSDLQFILSDMTQNLKLEDSITLAHRLQGSMVSGLAGKIGEVKDLGVKKGPFYVLVLAKMPSVLVEMFFITNKTEGRVMGRESYQDAVVDALYEGIRKYNESTMAAKTL